MKCLEGVFIYSIWRCVLFAWSMYYWREEVASTRRRRVNGRWIRAGRFCRHYWYSRKLRLICSKKRCKHNEWSIQKSIKRGGIKYGIHRFNFFILSRVEKHSADRWPNHFLLLHALGCYFHDLASEQNKTTAIRAIEMYLKQLHPWQKSFCCYY